MADEPPTNIDAAPNFSASFASFTDDLMFETSESIKTKITRDLLRLDNSNFSNLKANDLMNKNPLTAIETDNLQLAETRMREAKVQCLVVKNKINEVVGVIQIFE